MAPATRSNLAFLFTLAAIGLPPGLAFAQGDRDETLDSGAKLPGRIYVASVGRNDPLMGVTAFDPNERTWHKITDGRTEQPRVSPDGRRLALRKELRPGVREFAVWVFDLAAAEPPVKVFDGGYALAVGWSSDSAAVLISASPPGAGAAGAPEIWRVAVDGSKKEKIPFAPPGHIVDWSPDGRWLLTTVPTTRISAERPIKLIRHDGTGERVFAGGGVPKSERAVAGSLQFSPDSRQVLMNLTTFENLEVQPPKPESTSLVVADVAGTRQRRFFERTGNGLSMSACWSPDGTTIAVLVVDGARRSVLEHDLDAKTQILIVNTEGRLLRSIPMPDPWLFRTVFAWR